MKVNYLKISLTIAAIVAIIILLRSCSGCGSKEETTTNTTTVIEEKPGETTTETPTPTVQIPHIDSSIYTQLEKYKALWLAEKKRLNASKKDLEEIEALLSDTTLSLEKRYTLLNSAKERLQKEVELAEKNGMELQKQLEEAATASYMTEGVDSTESYKMQWRIFSRAPLLKDGFQRKIDVYEKTTTTETTTTKTEYPNLFLGAMYHPGVNRYSLLVGKDWGRFGVISQLQFDKNVNLTVGGGFKYNF